MVRCTCGPYTMSSLDQRWGRATTWCGGVVAPLVLPFGLRVHVGKIGGWVFVPSNSGNISCVSFLKRKTAENTQLAL